MKSLISVFRRKRRMDLPTAPNSGQNVHSDDSSSDSILYPNPLLGLKEETPDPEIQLTVLRNFACPFRTESTCRHEDTPTNCIFGHPTTAPSVLLPIPDYICIYHLLGKCKNPRKIKQITSGPKKSQIVIRGCTSAVHLDPILMIDLDQYEAQYAAVISEYFTESKSKGIHRKRRPVPEPDLEGDEGLECGICLERIRSKYLKENRQFALLEKCDHILCAPCCLTNRRTNRNNVNCPLCRIPSKRVVLSDRFWKSNSKEKKRLFDAYRCQCCENNNAVNDDDDEPFYIRSMSLE